MKKGVSIVLSLVGIFLLGLNLFGLFKSLRNNDIYKETRTYFKNDINLTEEQLLERLKISKESDKEFIINVNEAINNGIAHYWKDEGINKYNLRVPLYENYILFLASYLDPSKFKKYEYSNYKKAIERGIGLCSQHAIILSRVLENNNINSRIINISRHVVVSAEVDKQKKQWWVVDPDYGVVIKQDLQTILKSPDIIRPYYNSRGYDSLTINTLRSSYSKIEGTYDSAFEYSGKKRYYFEKLSYIGIWGIPLFFIGISMFLLKIKTN